MKISSLKFGSDVVLLSDLVSSGSVTVDQFVPRSWLESKDSASIELSGKWQLKKYNDIVDSESDNLSISAENGYKAVWTGKWRWVAGDDQEEPTLCNGSFGEHLFENKEYSEEITFDELTSSGSITQSIYVAKSGLEIVNNKVQKASGYLSISKSASVKFLHKYFFGYLESRDFTQSEIKSLEYVNFTDSRSFSFSGVTADSSQYVILAYPKSLGKLETIYQDKVIPALGSFSIKEINITNGAACDIEYFVYISNNKGAFTNSKLEIN